MTEEELRKIEERCNAATCGPWIVEHCENDCGVPYQHVCSDVDNGGTGFGVCDTYHDNAIEMSTTVALALEAHWGKPMKQRTTPPHCGRVEDAAFIAASRQDVPLLIAEVRRLRTALLALEELS